LKKINIENGYYESRKVKLSERQIRRIFALRKKHTLQYIADYANCSTSMIWRILYEKGVKEKVLIHDS